MTWAPTTAAEAHALVEHRRIHPTHVAPNCCEPWQWDLANAEETVADLEAEGWITSHRVSLPETTRRGREGSLDLTDFTEQVLYVVVAHGPICTEALNERYEGYAERLPALFPKRKRDTPRKRLNELEDGGFVRKTLGPDGKQLTWHGYGVWEATDKGRERCPALSEVAA
jgi:hypothetical protein